MPVSRLLSDPPAVGGAPKPFACSWTKGGLDAAWVHVSGELDLDTSPQLDRALGEARAEARLVVLDLRDLAFVGSSGIHSIVNASVRARQVGRRLVILRGPRHVERILTLTGSAEQLDIGGVASIPLAARISAP